MITLTTKSEHSYPIHSVSLSSNWVSVFLKEKQVQRVFSIVDEQVWKFHQHKIESFLAEHAITELGFHLVPSGEASKSVEGWSAVTDSLLNCGIRRNDAVFIFGGGVTGDLGSFAASTALRGIAVYQFPTTLLAMVDSAIGGKTGINHDSGKNRIGTFYQPEAVICDPEFLLTLPDEEWLCGAGEIIKYGCIEQPDLAQRLLAIFSSDEWKTHPDWMGIIQDSASIKARIVQEDEKETGIRAYLNFGHTFAHAIEKQAGYGQISHGVAVFWGCVAACELSTVLGYDIPKTIEQFIPFFKVKTELISRDTEALIQAMYADKKNKSEHITFIILEKMGKAASMRISQRNLIEQAWNYLFSKL